MRTPETIRRVQPEDKREQCQDYVQGASDKAPEKPMSGKSRLRHYTDLDTQKSIHVNGTGTQGLDAPHSWLRDPTAFY